MHINLLRIFVSIDPNYSESDNGDVDENEDMGIPLFFGYSIWCVFPQLTNDSLRISIDEKEGWKDWCDYKEGNGN